MHGFTKMQSSTPSQIYRSTYYVSLLCIWKCNVSSHLKTMFWSTNMVLCQFSSVSSDKVNYWVFCHLKVFFMEWTNLWKHDPILQRKHSYATVFDTICVKHRCISVFSPQYLYEWCISRANTTDRVTLQNKVCVSIRYIQRSIHTFALICVILWLVTCTHFAEFS